MSAGRVPMSLSVCRVLAWGVSRTSLSRLIWIDLTDLSFIISEMYSVRVSLLNLFQNLSLIFTFSSWENLQLDNTFLTDSRDSDLNLTGNDLHREGSLPASFHLRQTRIMLERSEKLSRLNMSRRISGGRRWTVEHMMWDVDRTLGTTTCLIPPAHSAAAAAWEQDQT